MCAKLSAYESLVPRKFVRVSKYFVNKNSDMQDLLTGAFSPTLIVQLFAL